MLNIHLDNILFDILEKRVVTNWYKKTELCNAKLKPKCRAYAKDAELGLKMPSLHQKCRTYKPKMPSSGLKIPYVQI